MLETHPSVLNAASISKGTILFCRRSGESPLDYRKTLDGNIRLKYIEAIACDGVTYHLSDIRTFEETEGTRVTKWEWAELHPGPRPWPCMPLFYWSVHQVGRVVLSETPFTQGTLGEFPNRAALVRASYNAVKEAKLLPQSLEGPFNDVRMEVLATADFDRTAMQVAGTLTAMRESARRLGDLEGFAYA